MPSLPDAFDAIDIAWKQGLPIVPLFGAGLSISAGIPATAAMRDYMAKVKLIVQESLDAGVDPLRGASAQLLQNGWPDPHDLNAAIMAKRKLAECLRKELPNVATFIEAEKVRWDNCPGNAWLGQLSEICDGSQVLKDHFFNIFERRRQPSLTHQFVAFLTALLDWRLILTTNFDTLLEQALRNQFLHPTVFELPEEGPLPDPSLIHQHFSLVKLHGGAFGRRMSHSLDYSLPDPSLRVLARYFPAKALLLVLGYSGSDKRVMSLIDHLVQNVQTDIGVWWILRGELNQDRCPFLFALKDKHGERVQIHNYRNPGRFLQELYSRLTTVHPVSTTSYRVLPQMAPRPRKATKSPKYVDDRRVVLVHSARSGIGTSSTLAKAVGRRSRMIRRVRRVQLVA